MSGRRALPPGRPRQGQGQGQTPPSVQGFLHAVPCPHCGKNNDLREHASQQLLDTGHEFDCGWCSRLFIVAGLATVQIVTVRASNKRAGKTYQQAAPARTIGQAELRRLLGGR